MAVDQRSNRSGKQLAEKLSAIGGGSQPATETRMILDGGHKSPFQVDWRSSRGGEASGQQSRGHLDLGTPQIVADGREASKNRVRCFMQASSNRPLFMALAGRGSEASKGGHFQAAHWRPKDLSRRHPTKSLPLDASEETGGSRVVGSGIRSTTPVVPGCLPSVDIGRRRYRRGPAGVFRLGKGRPRWPSGCDGERSAAAPVRESLVVLES